MKNIENNDKVLLYFYVALSRSLFILGLVLIAASDGIS